MKGIFAIFFLIFISDLNSGIELPQKISVKFWSYPEEMTQPKDTSIDVKDSLFLFIGDSHTANPHGWQYKLSKSVGAKFKNTSMVGKTTSWMKGIARTSVTDKYAYCFIWGGGNDMVGKSPVEFSVKNIQSIVDLCNQKGVTPVVLTGIPHTCPDVKGRGETWRNYAIRGERYKQMLVDSIKGAKVIRTDFISRSSGDCADFICHMNPSGHTKMAVGIRKSMRFKSVQD
jgi:GDSL-like Lipase/Acylhydrolase family